MLVSKLYLDTQCTSMLTMKLATTASDLESRSFIADFTRQKALIDSSSSRINATAGGTFYPFPQRLPGKLLD